MRLSCDQQMMMSSLFPLTSSVSCYDFILHFFVSCVLPVLFDLILNNSAHRIAWLQKTLEMSLNSIKARYGDEVCTLKPYAKPQTLDPKLSPGP